MKAVDKYDLQRSFVRKIENMFIVFSSIHADNLLI